MNLLFSCIGRRGYIAEWFREQLAPGDRIVGTGDSVWVPGFHACDLGVLMPDVTSPGYVPTLLDLCRKEEIDALLSFYDPDVDAISRHREQFQELGVLPLVPDARVSQLSLDKLATYEFLTEQGFRSPVTFAGLAGARAALRTGRLQYPLVVKPRFGFASRNLFLARSDRELEIFFAYAPDMIIQEQIGGEEHNLDVLCDLEGRVVSVVLKRKILMRAGETDQAETVRHAPALEVGVRLADALRAVGPLDVDLFVDGDEVIVLELNPRFGGAYPAAHLAGADFPRKIVDMLRGRSVEPDLGRYEVGVRMMKDYRILPAHRGELADLRALHAGSGYSDGATRTDSSSK
jgi:carbamoyl-phosphate synthase large subunit